MCKNQQIDLAKLTSNPNQTKPKTGREANGYQPEILSDPTHNCIDPKRLNPKCTA